MYVIYQNFYVHLNYYFVTIEFDESPLVSWKFQLPDSCVSGSAIV